MIVKYFLQMMMSVGDQNKVITPSCLLRCRPTFICVCRSVDIAVTSE